MYRSDGRGIWGYARSLCFIGSELRLLWFCADACVSFPAPMMALPDRDPKDFPAQE